MAAAIQPEFRPLGKTEMQISTTALGCWPIAGMTSAGVNDADSKATIAAAVEAGVNFFDTAYCYGRNGESERLLAPLLAQNRAKIILATKGGLHWNADGKQVRDGRPERLKQECEESLQRLGTDYIDLLYLHVPDLQVPVSESAGGLLELLQAGKARAIGVSNFSVAQLEEFSRVCPISACQPPYNLLVREIEHDVLPWCLARQVSVIIYWPLLKGLLAGKLARDHVFPPGDSRLKYPMFQGDEYQRNLDLVDGLRAIAAEAGRSVAAVAVNWTLCQPGITAALCGAKRADQILESAESMGWRLSSAQLAQIDQLLVARGQPLVKGSF